MPNPHIRNLECLLLKNKQHLSKDSLLEMMTEMVTQINHRGPDGQGVWTDSRVVLGHARLAIIDTSNGGFLCDYCLYHNWF